MSLSTKVVLTNPVPSGGTFAAPFPTDYYPGIFIRATGHQLADEAGSVYGSIAVDVQANNLVLTNDGDTTIRAGSYILSLSAVTRGEMLKAARVIEAAFGYDVFDANGDPVLRGLFIPRTGTLASLETLAGEVGEVGAATDGPELVKFNGVPGEAVVYSPYGPAMMISPVDAEAAYTINPNNVSSVLIDMSGKSFGPSISITPGRRPGQQINIYMRGGSSSAFIQGAGGAATVRAAVAPDSMASLLWADGAWRGSYSGAVAFSDAFSNPPYSGGVAALAPADGAIAIGASSYAYAEGAIAIGAGSGSNAESAKNSVSIGAGVAPIFPTFVHLGGAPVRFNVFAIGTLIAETSGAATANMTMDGGPVALADFMTPGTWSNVLQLNQFGYAAEAEITIFGRDMGGACVCYRRNLLLADVGGAIAIVNQQTVGADYEAAPLAAAAIALSVDTTDNYLNIAVTGVASKDILWCARVSLVYVA